MRKTVILGLLAAVFVVGIASASTMFGEPSSRGADDFCFGYAICE
jgi:hypothetical protein